MKVISIIIPCYNEEAMIDRFYEKITEVTLKQGNYKFIYLFVDDGSKDKTLEKVRNLEKTNEAVKYLSFSRNFGKEAAMFAGLEASKKLQVDACIFIDADLQDSPELILTFINYWEQGYKHIYGKHKDRRGQSLLKKILTGMFYKIYAFLTNDKNIAHGARDFSLLDRTVIDAFINIQDFQRFTKGIASYVGFKKKCVEFDYSDRAAGKTKWSFRKLFKYAMIGINQFSRIYMIIPNLVILIALGALGYDIIQPIVKDVPFTEVHIRIDVAVLLIALVLRILIKILYDVRDQARNRPIYIIENTNI